MITLKGKPRSTNSIYRTTSINGRPRTYMTREGKDVKEDYQWQVKIQWKKQPLSGKIGVDMDIYFGTKHKHDIDNFNKLCFDACNGVVWVDDSLIESLLINKYYDKENPRIELNVYEIA